ncbi:MAG: hypothetical protein AAB583_02125 [Patescibacteria group bacterium]
MLEQIFGIPVGIAITWGAGVLYAAGSVLFLNSFWREMKNELMEALFAFLASMALALLLMGLGEYWNNMLFGYLGSLAILIGSAFMLKFPLTVFSEEKRGILFHLILTIVLVSFIWMVLWPLGREIMPMFIMWYMIVANGLVAGFFIFFAGLRSKERAIKIKATGGGLGVVSCCIVSHLASMSGAILLSAVFQFMAPFLLVASVFVGRHYQRQEEKSHNEEAREN